MRRTKLFWRLFPTLLALAAAPLLVSTSYAVRAMRQAHLDQAADDLQARAMLVAAPARELMAAGDPEQLRRRAAVLGRLAGARVTLLARDGTVLLDSHGDPRQMENHADRPEVREALAHGRGHSVRSSRTVGYEMLYVAQGLDDRRLIRLSVPLRSLESSLRRVNLRVWLAAALSALLAGLASFLLARRISHSLVLLKTASERFAAGDLSHRLPAADTEEVAALSAALNAMAAELDSRLNTVVRQRNELEAALASMVEAVVAVDVDERILRLNQAAAELFDVRPEEATGRLVQEVLRNADLQRFVKRTLASAVSLESDVTIRRNEDIHLQATGTLLHDRDGRSIGALVVLNDVTRLRRLEAVRRDFVANVSHELRTPVTAIRGFVETLLDGALQQPAEAEHFLAIIDRQAERLQAIIEDLLTLSRIEQGVERTDIELQELSVPELLGAAAQACAPAAQEKGITIELDCDELTWMVNAALLEEAVVNLIDNAVKYSGEGRRVEVRAEVEGDQLSISVIDQGVGIAAEHLPRLFERFYRVDKARSRQVGGTGLGLAIVKHIVNAHRGRVEVASEPGRGSVFTITLPHLVAVAAG